MVSLISLVSTVDNAWFYCPPDVGSSIIKMTVRFLKQALTIMMKQILDLLHILLHFWSMFKKCQALISVRGIVLL